MRLRPSKGEGERSKSLIKKGPLLIATALFVGYPVCIAQAVTTSSALGLPTQYQQQTLKASQLQSQPRSYLSSKSLASLPSNQDLVDLQSILKSYKTQLETLKSSKPLDPDLSAEISQKLATLEAKITSLEAKIIRLKNSLTALQLAKDTLTSAIANLTLKTQDEASALSTYNSAKEKYDLDVAKLDEAGKAAEGAKTNLDNAKQEKDAAKQTFNEKSGVLNLAQANLDASSSELSTKQAEVDAARATYDQAVSYYNGTLEAYDLAYSNYLSKQSEYQIAQTNLNVAEAALNQAQYNYDNNLIPDPNHQGGESTPGITVRVYNQITSPVPERSDTAYNLCKTTTLTHINDNWGGGDILGCGNDFVMLHYTGYFTPTENITYLMNQADDGFYLSIDGVPVITNDWRLKGCSGNWYPINLEAGKTYYLDAWMYEWGGGACSTLYYQSTTNWGVAPAAWYTTSSPVPMIKDPAKLALLQEAQGEYNEALAAYTTASTNWNLAQADQQQAAQNATAGYYQVIDTATTLNQASDQLSIKQAEYNQALSTRDSAAQEVQVAQSNLEAEEASQASAQQSYNESLISLAAATSNEASSKAAADGAAVAYQDAQNKTSTSTSEKASAEAALSEAEATAGADSQEAVEANSTVSFTEIQELLTKEPKPQPQPEPEGSAEIPAVIEDLMDVDLEQVDPTELTPEQAEQLVEAALVAFETAEEGSPEYEQALDALYIAAQEDDIVLDESIAEIPGVGQAAAAVVAVFNIVGNVGADISPKARKKAQEVVVTTLVVGQIAQTAALAQAASGASYRRK